MICEKCGTEINHIWQIEPKSTDKHLEELIHDGRSIYLYVSDEWANTVPNMKNYIKCPCCMQFPFEDETIKEEKFRSLIMTRKAPNLDETINRIKHDLGPTFEHCLMSILEYREDVKTGCITDYDGSGRYYNIWGDKMGPSSFNLADIDEAIVKGIPLVVWHNK